MNKNVVIKSIAALTILTSITGIGDSVLQSEKKNNK